MNFSFAVVAISAISPGQDRHFQGLEAVPPYRNGDISDPGQPQQPAHPSCELPEPELRPEAGGVTGERGVHLADRAGVSPAQADHHPPRVQSLVPRPGGRRPAETRPVQRGQG